jgi:excisionase family DNA binding protein
MRMMAISGTLDDMLRGVVREALREELPALLREALSALPLARAATHAVRAVPTALSEGELLTVAEVAALLHVARPTVRRWIRSSRLPSCAIGPRRLVRVWRADLEKFAASDPGDAAAAPAPDMDAQAAKIVGLSRSRRR